MAGWGEPSVAERFMRLLDGKWVLQAISTAAELDLGRHLVSPLSLGALAGALNCPEAALRRLLRVLVGEGLLQQNADGRFELTEVGKQLREPGMRSLARFVGSPSQWVPWADLTHSIRTGDSAFERVYGTTLFEYLAVHAEEARLYDEAVDAFTAEQARVLAGLTLLGGVQRLVDVGGGRGTLLVELLRRWPHLRGVLVDRPDVVESARARFEAEALADRCEFSGGDFFETLPEGADCYVLKHVLHNWDDTRAEQLLARCARAATSGSVWVVEGVVLPGNVKDLTRLMDLEMLVLTGAGRERTKPEFRQLFRRAGLKLEKTYPLTLGAWLLIGKPLGSRAKS